MFDIHCCVFCAKSSLCTICSSGSTCSFCPLFGSNVLIVLFVLLVPDDSGVSDMLDILIIIQRKKADVFVVPRVLLVLYVLVVIHVLCSIL